MLDGRRRPRRRGVEREQQHKEEQSESREEFFRGTEEECADSECRPDAGRKQDDRPSAPSFVQESVVEVLVSGIALERVFLLPDASSDHEDEVDERNTEYEKGRSHLSAGVDREEAEHQPEEHGSRVADEHFGRLQIKYHASRSDAAEDQGDKRDIRLVDAGRERQKADGEISDRGKGGYLPGDAVEPVESVDGESDPEDGEEQA